MRNAMRCFFVLGIMTLLLCGCSKESGKEEKIDEMQEYDKQEENYLEIDDISWGMTVDETLKAYAVEKTDVEELTESTYATSFYIRDGREVFGTKTESILFNFMDATLSGKTQKLCSIDIVYADDVAMNGVLEQMKLELGETVPKIVQYDMSSMLSEDKVPRNEYEASDKLTLWASQTVSEVVPKERTSEYEKLWEIPMQWMSSEVWDKFAAEAPLVTGYCSDDASQVPVMGKKAVRLNALNLVIYNTITEQLENN